MTRKKRSAGAPTATREGACAPPAMKFGALGEDQGKASKLDNGIPGERIVLALVEGTSMQGLSARLKCVKRPLKLLAAWFARAAYVVVILSLCDAWCEQFLQRPIFSRRFVKVDGDYGVYGSSRGMDYILVYCRNKHGYGLTISYEFPPVTASYVNGRPRASLGPGPRMNRSHMLKQARERVQPWDIIVVGGGATGAGVAVDAATRGYSTLLLEQHDFGKGTSSRSTKLVHGGVRYLEKGNISLVMEALKERGLLRQNAPHLVTELGCVVPSYAWWEGPFYGAGLKLYELLAGKYGFGKSKVISKEERSPACPT